MSQSHAPRSSAPRSSAPRSSAPRSGAPRAAQERAHERKNTNVQVRWDHRTGERNTGALCDITPAGTFLTPFGRSADDIRDGDTVFIEVEAAGKRCSLAATVCWHGWSDHHGARGFGVRFDPTSTDLARQLYLELDRHGHFFVPSD